MNLESEKLKYCKNNNIIVKTIDVTMNYRYGDTEMSEGEYSVLRGFYPEVKGLTIAKIRERTGYSYEPAYSYLQSLVKKNIVSVEKVGKTLVYALDMSKWYAKRAYHMYALDRAIEFSRRSQQHRIIYNMLKEIPENKVEMIVLFGSYSRAKEEKESDIDVMIVSSEEKEVKNAVRKIRAVYNLELAEVILPKSEFAKIKDENKILWDELIRSAIIFKGYDDFYYYAYGREHGK